MDRFVTPPRLLYAPTLRVLCALTLAGLAPACERDRPPREAPEAPPEPPPRTSASDQEALARLLGVDASELASPTPSDPPSPSGNLADDIASFSDLDSCVRARAKLDPVVADAVEAIGYDTMIRDACRVLEALHTKSVAPCEPIASSSLRDHCLASVAGLLGETQHCPKVHSGHDPYCVAIAARDARLCSGVSSSRRTTCRAIIARDTTMCRGASRCIRAVERWSQVLPEAQSLPHLGSRVVLTLSVVIDGGATDPRTFTLSDQVLPALVREGGEGKSIVVGEASAAAWPPDTMATQPRLSLTFPASPERIKQGTHNLLPGELTFAILLPRYATIRSDTMDQPAVLQVDVVKTDLGEPVRFKLQAEAGESSRRFRIELEVNTYVRDRVD